LETTRRLPQGVRIPALRQTAVWRQLARINSNSGLEKAGNVKSRSGKRKRATRKNRCAVREICKPSWPMDP